MWFKKKKKEEETPDWVKSILGAMGKIKSEKGTDQDEMPEGYGEFGLEVTNPIPMSSIPATYFYLRKLRTQNGNAITYKRIGSMRASNIESLIDSYTIYENNVKIAILYICPYNRKDSTKTPKKFIFAK
jgi:hypothetical protein